MVLAKAGSRAAPRATAFLAQRLLSTGSPYAQVNFGPAAAASISESFGSGSSASQTWRFGVVAGFSACGAAAWFLQQQQSKSKPAHCRGWGFGGSSNNNNNDNNNEVVSSAAASGIVENKNAEDGGSGSSSKTRKFEETAIFAGSSGEVLAQQICGHLGVPLGKVDLTRFADGEVGLRFCESIRGKAVYIIQPTSPPVNENLMELLLMISTLKRSSAKRITAVIPYYGYARQDRKMNSRVPISAADVALMIETMGADRVISVDLHSGQIQGFFRPAVPVDNLEAGIVGIKYFRDMNLERPVIVSPDAGGVYRARKFQEGLGRAGVKDVGLAMLIKQRRRANEIDRMDLVGVVEGSDCVIVDDMIDTAGTLCEAALNLKRAGAKRVFAFATHGLFSGKALDRINASVLEEVLVTDSIQLRPEATACPKIRQLSIANMLSDVINRIHHKESLEPIFQAQHLGHTSAAAEQGKTN